MILDPVDTGFSRYWIQSILDSVDTGSSRYRVQSILDSVDIGSSQHWIHWIHWIQSILDSVDIGFSRYWIQSYPLPVLYKKPCVLPECFGWFYWYFIRRWPTEAVTLVTHPEAELKYLSLSISSQRMIAATTDQSAVILRSSCGKPTNHVTVNQSDGCL